MKKKLVRIANQIASLENKMNGSTGDYQKFADELEKIINSLSSDEFIEIDNYIQEKGLVDNK